MGYDNANERAAAGIDIGSAEQCDRLIAALDRNAALIAAAIMGVELADAGIDASPTMLTNSVRVLRAALAAEEGK